MQAVQRIEREKRMDGGKEKEEWTIPILLPQSEKGRSVSGRNCSLRSGLLALALLPVFDTTSPGKGGFRNHVHRCGVVAFLHIAFVLCVKVLVRPPFPTAKLCFIGEISAGQADQISIGIWKYNGVWIFLVQCVDAPSVIHFWFLHILKSVGCKFRTWEGRGSEAAQRAQKSPQRHRCGHKDIRG